MDLIDDCARFLKGLAYEVENKDGHLTAKKSLHNRSDQLRVRFLLDVPASTIPRETWKDACKTFDSDGTRLGKYLIVRDGIDITARHHEEARSHRLVISHFSDFLARFAKLDELRQKIRKKIKEEHGDPALLQARFVEPAVTLGPDGVPHQATTYLTKYWLGQQSNGLLVILAPPGHGKSTLSVVAAIKLLSTKTLPILIPFSAYKRLVNFGGLVYEFFNKHEHEPLSLEALSVILKHNLATIILDGFDELCETAGITTARENLSAVYHGVERGGKVLLTARTAFFRSAVSSTDQPKSGHFDWDEAHMEPFDKSRQDEFVRKRLGANHTHRQRVSAFIESIPGADDLASSPLVLKELCDLASDLPSNQSIGNRIAPIYDWLFEKHCQRERERQGYDFSTQTQAEILSEIAEWCLLDWNQDPSHQKAKTDDVKQIIEGNLVGQRVYDRDTISKAVPKLLSHALLNTTKSNAVTERYIRFLHHTWHDFLIARRILGELHAGKISRIADTIRYYRVLPEYVAKFLADLLDEASAKKLFSAPELRTTDSFSQMLKIAQEFARKKSTDSNSLGADSKLFFSLLDIPSFEGRDVWQAQLVYLSLTGTSFKKAVISDSTFRKCDLNQCDFSGATLQRVTFDNCDVEGAIFNGTKGLTPEQIREVTEGGAIVDGVNHAGTHQRQLASQLVQKVLRKFKTRNAHQTEPVWRRGFSPINQRRVREVVLPMLTRHGYLEFLGDKGNITRSDKKFGVWSLWVDSPGSTTPSALNPIVLEIQKKLQ